MTDRLVHDPVALGRTPHGRLVDVVEGDVAAFGQALKVVAHDVGVHVAVGGQLPGRGAGVFAKVEIDLATSAVAKRVRQARDRCRKEGRIELVLVGRRHIFEFTGVGALWRR